MLNLGVMHFGFTLLYLLYFTYFTLLYWIEADTNPGLLSLTKKKWARIGPERWRLEAEAGFVAG